MFKKLILFTSGLVVLSLGVTLNTRANLGISPILALPFFITQRNGISLGLTSFYFYLFCLAVQFIIYTYLKQYKQYIQLGLQLPISILNSFLIDLMMAFIPDLGTLPTFYQSSVFRLSLVIISLVIVGIGAAMMVSSKLMITPPDGIVQAIAVLTNHSMSFVKISFDTSLVIVTFLLALALQFPQHGIHIGTIFGMFIVGKVMAWYENFFLSNPLNKAEDQ